MLTLTLLAGLIQLAMGLARLGALVNFISHTVIIGFTAGAAILITARAIGFIDLAGAELLAKEATRRRKLCSGISARCCAAAARSTPWARARSFRHKGEALQAIYPRLDNEICRTCKARIFRECHVALPDGTPRSVSDAELAARAAIPTAA